jgi:hypothetical protein
MLTRSITVAEPKERGANTTSRCRLSVALPAELGRPRGAQRDGDEATAKARKIVKEMRRKGDNEGADTWLRIIVAIGELGETAD